MKNEKIYFKKLEKIDQNGENLSKL